MTMLEELGLSPRWEALFEPYASDGLILARVVRSDRGSALIATEGGVVRAKPATRLLKTAKGPADLPAVGDWVAVLAPEDSAPSTERFGATLPKSANTLPARLPTMRRRASMPATVEASPPSGSPESPFGPS